MELERSPTSALIKRLRDASRAKPRSLGFGRREDAPAATAMVLIAQVAGLDPSAASAATAAGAAAVAFAVTGQEASAIAAGETGRLREAVGACGDAVAGLLFEGDLPVPADLAARVEGLGLDFAICTVERAPAALLGQESLALVARVDDYGERPAFLRALGELKADAVLAGPAQPTAGHAALTVFDLMGYKLVVESVRQPVLVVADAAIRPEDLQTLRDVGVDGLVVAAGDAAALGQYRDAIAKVKITRRATASANGGPLLPRLSPTGGGSSDDGGDEDDD
jgi:hypothetical protein